MHSKNKKSPAELHQSPAGSGTSSLVRNVTCNAFRRTARPGGGITFPCSSRSCSVDAGLAFNASAMALQCRPVTPLYERSISSNAAFVRNAAASSSAPVSPRRLNARLRRRRGFHMCGERGASLPLRLARPADYLQVKKH